MPAADQPITFARAFRIAGYNWPLYGGAGLGILVGGIVACLPEAPLLLRALAAAGAAVAAWFACASFGAFHWMFDRSELLHGQWLTEEMAPARWVQINVGLEETTVPLSLIFPEAEGKMLDLYDPAVMTEPAITQARQGKAGAAAATAAAPEALPVDDGWADLILVMLAAHEIRDERKRERFFQELRRIVAPRGRVMVAEHLRDLAAALAFGPGILHFFPHGEWLRLGRLAGLHVERERRITPFVRVFIYRCQEAA
jgi:SAM-dependent methyltransferase